MSNPFGQGKTFDFVGKRFYNFIVIERLINKISKKSNKEYVVWKCLCDCGKEFITTTKSIRKKDFPRKSCGCLRLKSQFRKSLSNENANLRKVISHYKSGAKRRNIEWKLTEKEAIQFLLENCFYCGTIPNRSVNYFQRVNEIKITGIDRKDNNQGYLLTNCVPCCSICNRAKLDLSFNNFLTWIKGIKSFV